MNGADFDNKVDQMIIADGIRSRLLPYGRRNIYLVTESWTMQDDPWFLIWTQDGKSMGVYLLGAPTQGEKYVMFNVYDEIDERHVQYVFLKDQYIAHGDEE